jgi:hypothetical protein
MRSTSRSGRQAGVALALSALLSVAAVGAAPAAIATVGNSLRIVAATTNTTLGGAFSVTIVGNSAVQVSGTSASLTFDNAKLQVTSIAKGAEWTDGGATWLGYPSGANLATFLANANTAGKIPAIAASFLDGSSALAAGDHTLLTVSFSVSACGDSGLGLPLGGSDGSMLDGEVATYGQGLVATSTSGTVSAPCASVPPTAALGTVAATQLGTSVALSWSATPGSAALASYDVRYRKAAWNGVFGAYVLWQSATSSTTAPFTLAAGYTYCFSSAARDVNGLASGWTADKCTVAPLDDRSLTTSGTWSRKTSASFYKSTYSQSTALNAKLNRTTAKFKRIYLVATTCPTCGSVRVYLGTTLLKSVSLVSATTVNKKVITVYASSVLKSGTVSIKVTSSGKAVKIDGLALGQF